MVFFFSPLACSGSERLYTATRKFLDGTGEYQIVIDGGPAYSLTLSDDDASGVLGPYRRYSDFPVVQMDAAVQGDQILALLSSGYPVNIGGLEQTYNLTDAEAYQLTQQALWILMGQSRESEMADGTPEQRDYIKALLEIGREAISAETQLQIQPDTVCFSRTENDFRTNVLQSHFLTSGFLDCSELPDTIRVLSEDGKALSSPIAAGSRFLLASDSPVEAETLTLRYLYHPPVLYRYEASETSSGTLVSVGYQNVTQSVPVQLTVEKPDDTPESQNPGTGNALLVTWVFVILGVCVWLLAILIRRRRS